MSKRMIGLFLILTMMLGLVCSASAQAAQEVTPAVSSSKLSSFQCYAVIDEAGGLWTWGENSDGQLGIGTTEDSYKPTKVLDGVMAVSTGWRHTVALKTDGTVWAWGYNSDGQLGNGTTESSYFPVQIMDGVVAVSAGNFHTVAIKEDGTLWAWGCNIHGRLGNGNSENLLVPTQVMSEVVAASAGYAHTAAIKKDGTLWTWGFNSFGQLGDGTASDSSLPKQIDENVTSVCAGFLNTAFVKTDGTLWLCGDSTYNQVLTGSSGQYTDAVKTPIMVMQDVREVSLGTNMTVAATWCDGAFVAAIQNDGSLWTWGKGIMGDGNENRYGKPPVKILENVCAVAPGYSGTIAQKEDGTIWGWGNVFGEGNKLTPERIDPKIYSTENGSAAADPAIDQNQVESAPSDKTTRTLCSACQTYLSLLAEREAELQCCTGEGLQPVTLQDINGDRIPELFLLLGHKDTIGIFYSKLEIWSYNEDDGLVQIYRSDFTYPPYAVKRVFQTGQSDSIYFYYDEGDHIYYTGIKEYGLVYAGDNLNLLHSVEKKETMGNNPPTNIIFSGAEYDGENISEAEFNDILDSLLEQEQVILVNVGFHIPDGVKNAAMDLSAATAYLRNAIAEPNKEETIGVVNGFIDSSPVESSPAQVFSYDTPFYGIWCSASQYYSGMQEYAAQLQAAGYAAEVFTTTDWSDLNSEKWYVVSAGRYYTESDALAALPGVKAYFPNAYVKYTGEYQG